MNMSLPLQMKIRESIPELRAMQRQHCELIGKRLQILIEIKKNEDKGGISKRDLSRITGINHNSIVKWRKQYLESGIEVLLSHGRKGFKQSKISSDEHKKIEARLKDPKNGLRGYKELMEWVENEFGKKINYTTLYEYVKRNFGTKIKVARKSHVKKDDKAVESFKKTLGKSVPLL
jgi:transposase